MKKALKIIGGIVIGIGIIIGLAFFLTQGVVDATDKFFTFIKQGNVKEAYNVTSSAFQNSETYDSFSQYLKTTKLDMFESSFWNSRSFSGNLGKVEGTITTKDHTTIPVTIELINENNTWKILSIDIPYNKTTENIQQKLPSDNEIETLVHNTMTLFVGAVKNEDFSKFYDSIADIWKKETSAEKIQKAFAQFISKKIDLSFITSTSAILSDKPTINEDGRLYVNGYYVSENATAYFKLIYNYEYPNWKLTDIDIKIR